MIIGNTIKFGYGDIAMTANPILQTLNFHQSKSTFDCGCTLNGEYELLLDDPIIIKINYNEYKELCRLLDNVKFQNILEFDFKDYKFDFTNYNENSIKVFEKILNHAMSSYYLTIAC